MEKWRPTDDVDIEASSTACSDTDDLLRKEGLAPRSNPKKVWRTLSHIRLFFEFILVMLLVGVGVQHARSSKAPLMYGPKIPRKPVILGNTAGLGPDVEYHNHEMLWNTTEMGRIHRNWAGLYPKGRGYVRTDPSDDFQILHPPWSMDNALVEGDHYEGYIMAVFHQLHCLSILTTALGTSQAEWRAMDDYTVEHRTHCVEYLRQSILCNADTTLEGETGSWATSTGWGQTHSCVDHEALMRWADERSIWDLEPSLLPESFDFKAENGSSYGG